MDFFLNRTRKLHLASPLDGSLRLLCKKKKQKRETTQETTLPVLTGHPIATPLQMPTPAYGVLLPTPEYIEGGTHHNQRRPKVGDRLYLVRGDGVAMFYHAKRKVHPS